MASTSVEETLSRHLKRSYALNEAYRTKVRGLQVEFVPPWDPSVGWDTHFMPRRDKQAYVPVPVVWFTVQVMSSLMGMRTPVFKNEPKTSDPKDRDEAANAELLIKYEQQRQDMDIFHLDLSNTLSLKGRGGAKVGYGPGDDLWTENIDAIENLWPEFSDNSYRDVRTYSYHSMVSPDVAREDYGWKGDRGGGWWSEMSRAFQLVTAANPLGRSSVESAASSYPEFEGVPMVDFHYAIRDSQNRIKTVRNALFIGSQLISDDDIKMTEFPYLEVNCQKESGNPFGIGDAEPVVGLQKEIATRTTAWAEAIRRNGQDQWVTNNVRGLTPKDLPGGGRYFPLGDKETEDIRALKFPIDDLGFQQYLGECWENYRRITGIPPEVLGGGHVNAGTSGYAMAVKFQSVITRLGPRQTRLKAFYRDWARKTFKNMELVTPSSKGIIAGNYFTSVDFESITPKDFAQQVTSLATAVHAGIYSKRSAMEDLNLVSEDEFEYMREANADAELSPQTAAAIAAVKGQMQGLASGNQATADGVLGAAKAAPDASGENQHTMPGRPVGVPAQLPQRDTAAQLVGAASTSGGISVNPPA